MQIQKPIASTFLNNFKLFFKYIDEARPMPLNQNASKRLLVVTTAKMRMSLNIIFSDGWLYFLSIALIYLITLKILHSYLLRKISDILA